MNTQVIALFASIVMLLHNVDAGYFFTPHLNTIKNKVVEAGRLSHITGHATTNMFLSGLLSGCRGHDLTNVRIDGQVVIITGGDSGIGYETALDLAKRGGRIYLACRNTGKAEEVRQKIADISHNPNVFSLYLNLASIRSIQEFVANFKSMERKLNILVNSAGVMGIPRDFTADMIEKQFGINHIGPFLLTNFLLDIMKSSAFARIIIVSSIAHVAGTMHFNDLELQGSYEPWKAYCQSKLANNIFAHELANRLQNTNVTVNSMNPGVLHKPLLRYLGLLSIPLKLVMKTEKEGAQTVIRLAIDPALNGVRGQYFSNCELDSESKKALNNADGKRLWDMTNNIIRARGFDFNL